MKRYKIVKNRWTALYFVKKRRFLFFFKRLKSLRGYDEYSLEECQMVIDNDRAVNSREHLDFIKKNQGFETVAELD